MTNADCIHKFRPSLAAGLVLTIFSGVMCLGGILMLREGNQLGWFALVFVVSLIVIPIHYFTSGLEIYKDGFKIISLRRSIFYSWDDVEDFCIIVIARKKMVGFNFSKKFDRSQVVRSISKSLSGREGALPDTYRMKAEKLLDLMIKFKEASSRHQTGPEHTAVRTALWRALHVILDSKPHILIDEIGAEIVAEENWRNRPDMAPDFSKSMRASIVGRARFIEDLVEERFKLGVQQYVILGAGLDTFAIRRQELASKMRIFEVDQPGPQAWKQKRLSELGMKSPEGLHFVPVDFEAGESWWDELNKAGFDKDKPAVIVSTGVSMYLSKEANLATLRQIAHLAPNSTFAMTFMLALDLLDPKERSIMEFVMKRANESGTPFVSLFSPEEIVGLAKSVGFHEAKYVSAHDIYLRYFANRSDGLNAGNAEAFLVATIA